MFSILAAIVPVFLLSGGLVWFLSLGLRTRNWTLFACKMAMGVFVSMGVAAGVSSTVFFVGLVFKVPPGNYPYFEAILLFGASLLLVGVIIGNRNRDHDGGNLPAVPNSSWITGPFAVAFSLVASWAVIHFLSFSRNIPHGLWDAWAIWNLRAKFLFAGGTNWTVAFGDAFQWSHPDYPLLLPTNVARLWRFLGHENPQVPRFIAMGFTFGIIGVITSALSLCRSPSQGLIAGMVLLSSQFFLEQGASQYADVPLTFFIVSSLAAVALYDRCENGSKGLLVLAGLSAGFAAWTKNEGMFYVVCFVCSRTLVSTVLYGWRAMLWQQLFLGLGLVPVLICVQYFKVSFAGHNDLIAGSTMAKLLHQLGDGTRYVLIAQSISQQLREIPVLLVVSLAIFVVFVGSKLRRELVKASIFPILLLIFLSLGYFLVYVLTPIELKWHLDTSLPRILLHLLPTLVFTLFLTLGTIEESLRQAETSSHLQDLNNWVQRSWLSAARKS